MSGEYHRYFEIAYQLETDTDVLHLENSMAARYHLPYNLMKIARRKFILIPQRLFKQYEKRSNELCMTILSLQLYGYLRWPHTTLAIITLIDGIVLSGH